MHKKDKVRLQTKTKCLALSIFSFVFGNEIGKHSSLSKTSHSMKLPKKMFFVSPDPKVTILK